MGKIGVIELFLVGAIIVLFIIPQIFFLLTLKKTFKEISAENRQMISGQVWLALIPLFGMIWQFFIIDKLALSLKDEFKKRNIVVNEDKPGYSIGLAYCILMICSLLPIIGFFTAVPAVVCWIIYWVKISNYKRELEATKEINLSNIGN